jgi:hypothetical protein
MLKYKIEGDLNFYDALFKSLDNNDTDDEENVCQITGLPLINNYVTLECNHKFNYNALYTEVCRQKFVFKTYDFISLSNVDKHRFKDSKLDYFIKCPYCRCIQFTLLPYYEELGLEKKYGVNSLDISLHDKTSILCSNSGTYYGSDDYTFFQYGVLFKKGQCCFNNSQINDIDKPINDIDKPINDIDKPSDKPTIYKCYYKYVANIPNTDVSYCKFHYMKKFKEYKNAQKEKEKDEKKKQKESILNERQKILDEKNSERLAKGLPLLKRLPIIKKNGESIENIVSNAEPISQYVPDNDTKKEKIDNDKQPGCISVLKTGPNKGEQCGCKKINELGFCKRHHSKMSTD